jgi:phosphoglucomutase
LRKPVAAVVVDHWRRFGRSYYQRNDYEHLEIEAATRMMDALREKLSTVRGASIAGTKVSQAEDFSYTDPVDGSVSSHQGIRILLEDGSRLVCRLSGTGTEGATLRLYLERYLQDGGDQEITAILAPLNRAARELLELRERLGSDEPTLTT